MPFTNTVNLKQFLSLYASDKNRVVPFVGAGLAMPLFPSWKTLLLEMVDLCSSQDKLIYDREEIVNKVNNGQNFLEIADACVESLGKTGYRGFLESNFDKQFNEDSIPNAYKKLFDLKPQTIITTNYDSIPEVASKGTYKIFNNKNVAEALRAFEQNKDIVVKLHGDISSHESIVLTNQEYNKIIYDAAVQNFLRTIFSSKTLLFLGFGLTDIHTDLILRNLHTINSGITITHYALMSISSKFDIDSLEKKYGIKVIPYTSSDDSHPEVLEFLQMLENSKPISVLKKFKKLETQKEVSLHFGEVLKNTVGSDSFSVTYEKAEECYFLTYQTRANTEFELQTEILHIAKSINFETSIVKQFIIFTQDKSDTEKDFDKSFPVILGSSFSYNAVLDFNYGRINEVEFWSNIHFFRPNKVGTFLKKMIPISFPHIGATNEG